MKFRYMLTLGLLLTFLVGCSAQSATPLATQTVAPSILINTAQPGTNGIILSVLQEDNLSAQQPSPAVFPSGITELFLRIEFKGDLAGMSNLLDEDPNWVQVTGNSGVVELEQIKKDTKLSFGTTNGGFAIVLPLRPTKGVFADGTYEAVVTIKGKKVAALNWTVGPSK